MRPEDVLEMSCLFLLLLISSKNSVVLILRYLTGVSTRLYLPAGTDVATIDLPPTRGVSGALISVPPLRVDSA